MRGISALIVDDNRNMRSLVRAVLRSLEAKALEAADGADALDLVRHTPLDLVIVDFNMQPIDGVEFTRFLRQDRNQAISHLPVIMLTGHTRRDVILAARDAGVDEMLAKPISAQGLYSRISAVVNERRPFIQTGSYFGPCRRRFTGPNGELILKRRRGDEEAA